MFVLICLDLAVGIAVVLTVALDPSVYNDIDHKKQPDDVRSSDLNATVVLLII